jgi:tetratricopeptide (TPR) repeat protein
MKRRLIHCGLLFLLALGLASTAAAGDLEDRLINEAMNGNADTVRSLLEKGANVNAKDGTGETALMKAAYYGYADVVSVLIEKGASVEAKNSNGETALQLAELRKHAEVVQLLRQALSNDPRANFTEYLREFQKNPYDEARREKVVNAAAALPSLPAIPEEARQLFLQATALIKQNITPNELAKPIELLNHALVIAPWWGNAYYNLSRALELSGQCDEAVKQLNYYLELKPSEADATEARAHISVIQAEKEAAAQKKQENEGVLAVKYVSGGITRLRYHEEPTWWTPSSGRGVGALYVYAVPEEDPFYVNVFRMPNGHLLIISLLAQSNNGAYAGDRIAVRVWEGTERGCHEGYTFAFGEHSYTDACGVHYDVSVSNQNQPNAYVTVTYTPGGASVTIPVALLYRGRALKGRGWPYGDGTVYEAGEKIMVLHFDSSVATAAQDPNVNAMGLTPTSVTPYQGNK